MQGERSATSAYVDNLISTGAAQRIPESVRAGTSHALYRIANRNGIDVVAVGTGELPSEVLERILKYRLGAYLAAGYLNVDYVYERGLQHEPLTSVSPGDIHIVASAHGCGTILCYAAIRSVETAQASVSVGMCDRPLFPVEEAFGADVFRPLRLLADAPISAVRELGRFVKNHTLTRLDERAIRVPIEIVAAITRLLTEVLHTGVKAVVGEVEEHVAKRNMDYFHWPSTLFASVRPAVPADSYAYPHYRDGAPRPFAMWTPDLVSTLPRLNAIEAALETPGRAGVQRLLELRRSAWPAASTLVAA